MKTFTFLAAAFITLAGVACAQDDATSHDASFTKDGLFKADVNKLTDTQLVVSPDLPLAPDKNVLWCGTLQLAWNEAAKLVGEKMRFDPPSPAADLLNDGTFTHHDLDPASYVAMADFERNHVEAEIRAALEKTFHGAASPELIPPVPTNPGPYDFVAYSFSTRISLSPVRSTTVRCSSATRRSRILASTKTRRNGPWSRWKFTTTSRTMISSSSSGPRRRRIN
jgi:hypothetical protein